MTSSFATTLRRAAFALTVAVPLWSMTPSAGFAYTVEAQQMCTNDAFRLCAAEIPNIPKITACMFRHRADLSPGCRAVMDRDMSQKPRAVAAQ
ncbi:hypothetical protein [Bradyrhizobium sp.]|jgi:hypothetical protein|uniref:hypothetical protein n=1 Tax=Bradyrhizobium sp. TaxID=376 RepID=UPI003BB06D01